MWTDLVMRVLFIQKSKKKMSNFVGFGGEEKSLDYLTVGEMADLKGCSVQYVKRICKEGKIKTELWKHPQNKQSCYMIPVSALPEDLQTRYYRRKRAEAGVLPEKVDSEKPLKYHSKGNKKAFEEMSETERVEIKRWTEILTQWQGERNGKSNKTEFDRIFVAHQKYLNPDLEISTDILYRKYSAYKNEFYAELADNRGGWNRGMSKLDDESVIWQNFLSLYFSQSKPTVSWCYRTVRAYITEEYPEFLGEMPSEMCFRRKIKTLPAAVLEYAREGDKALHDHCIPYANRRKSDIFANDIWVMDNYTFDVITQQNGNMRRMYITTVLDVKSGVLVGWNITESPDSNSTLDALRFAMMRFGIPKNLYFDNGREFTTLDIAGGQKCRKIAKNKQGNIPATIVEKLGIRLIFAKVTNAQAKVVERVHRIIKEQFCRGNYGYCGGNVTERPEILKNNIKNGCIETEKQLKETFSDYADNVFNVAEYGGGEARFRGMTAIEVWNASIAETSLKKASRETLDLLMLRNAGFQKIKRDGVFVAYHGEKIWYYDKNITWQHIGEEVCVRYDRDDLSVVRIYDKEDRFLYSWECADWLMLKYFDENKQKIAELGRRQADVVKQVKARARELRGDASLTQREGLKYVSGRNTGKFKIRLPKNIVIVTANEEPTERMAVGAEATEIDPYRMLKNAEGRRNN